MTILVVGASGATGKHLVEHLLNRGHHVRVIVRSKESISEFARNHELITLIEASVLDLSDTEMAQHVLDCDAVASCLGHNMTFKGMFGKPRRLVTDAASRLCNAIKSNKPEKSCKYVLMNSSGNSNRDLNEPISFSHRLAVGLLRMLLPPHVDNEKASDYLRINIGQNDKDIEWSAVRPVNLINEEQVSEYKIYTSPIKSAIFDKSTTSRTNVAHFMADLITDDEVWTKWKGQMPVIC